uniref:Uncharacterized protein n=1 Tax=Chlamydomonas leiostraca TaxID=1034604 RepID=A0A7S0WFI6_9CHLO|mmetsp:Transcript_12293/g.30044  ORF Transcript_12293/g.30044 Transcript_12293/m.30044 type:complete len:504 (+) Transcript_12293:112-1623(+)
MAQLSAVPAVPGETHTDGGTVEIIEPQNPLDIEAIVSNVVSKIHLPLEIMKARSIGKAWHTACAASPSWSGVLCSLYGHTLGVLRRPAGTDTAAWLKELTLFSPEELKGWCEDRFTLGGEPYLMHLHAMAFTAPAARLRARRAGTAESTWSYTQPSPRTRFRLEVAPPGEGPVVPTAPGGTCPLYLQRVSLQELERMPGSGPVDVPNHYHAFRLGPCLLGCFMLPEVNPQAVQLAGPHQMLGCILLYDARLLLTDHDAPPPPGTYAHAVHESPAATAPAAAAAAEAQAPQPPAPLPPACQRLSALTGLVPGAVLAGAVLTNYKITCSHTHLERGHAQLGAATLRVKAVAPVADNELSREPRAVLGVTFEVTLHGPREWQIRKGGELAQVVPDDEEAYSGECVFTAHCVVNPDGVFMPDRATALQTTLPAEPNASRLLLGARAAEGGLGGARHLDLVDTWPLSLRGVASGGVVGAVAVHPVVGRAVLCVSAWGLEGLAGLARGA